MTAITAYRATCEGIPAGTFRPIRAIGDGPAVVWQGTDDASGRLLGVLYPDGRYDAAGAVGNWSWELCDETPAHARLRELASSPLGNCLPFRFTRI